MVRLKCQVCGKEYNLEKGEDASDYQCFCGGSLKSTKRQVIVRILLIIILIIASYFIGFIATGILDSYNII